jgi:hypothetical protein
MLSVALLAAAFAAQPALAVLGHSASGTGTSTQNNGSSFDFTATGGPGATGGGATGSMTYQQVQGNHTVEADVRCLFVSGNRATVVGLIVASTITSGVGSVGNHMIFFVEDNGTPGAGVDEWSAFFGGASETDCRQFVDLANPILTGEIVVSEVAPPPPPPPPCPPGDDDGDDDGLTDDRESLFGSLLDDSDSDDDGVSDGNEDSDDDGEDDEDEDDDEDGCPNDSDGDGTDDEDEDD